MERNWISFRGLKICTNCLGVAGQGEPHTVQPNDDNINICPYKSLWQVDYLPTEFSILEMNSDSNKLKVMINNIGVAMKKSENVILRRGEFNERIRRILFLSLAFNGMYVENKKVLWFDYVDLPNIHELDSCMDLTKEVSIKVDYFIDFVKKYVKIGDNIDEVIGENPSYVDRQKFTTLGIPLWIPIWPYYTGGAKFTDGLKWS